MLNLCSKGIRRVLTIAFQREGENQASIDSVLFEKGTHDPFSLGMTKPSVPDLGEDPPKNTVST